MTVNEDGSGSDTCGGVPPVTGVKTVSPGTCLSTSTNSGCRASSICLTTSGAMASKLDARLICSAMLLSSRWAS